MDAEITAAHNECLRLGRSKDWAGCLKILDVAISKNDKSADLFCNRGLCNSHLDLHKHAVRDYTRALELDPGLLQAWIRKGHSLMRLRRHHEALEVWQKGAKFAASGVQDLEMCMELEELASGTRRTESASQSQTRSFSMLEENENYVRRGATSPPPASQFDENCHQANHNRKADQLGAVREISIIKHGGSDDTPIDMEELERILGKGIEKVNVGRLDEAIEDFTRILKKVPKLSSALVARGTAYALQGKLETAIRDFTQAIEYAPRQIEAWKRRGQARAALGLEAEVLSDYAEAVRIDPNAADTYLQRGMFHYKLKDFESAEADMRITIEKDPYNKQAWNFLGLSLTSSGRCLEAVKAYQRAFEIDPGFKEAMANMGQAYKEHADSQMAADCFRKVLKLENRHPLVRRLWGLMRHGLGNHRGAIETLTKAIEYHSDDIECYYIRGSCHHALGNYHDATADYGVLLCQDHGENFRMLQYLAFYQQECMRYTATKLDLPFRQFDIDKDLDPVFKEAWCKKHPPQLLIPGYVMQPLIRSGREAVADLEETPERMNLIENAIQIGQLIQNQCPGFLHNVRQHHMAGFAIIEIAQTVSRVWKEMKQDSTARQRRTDEATVILCSASGSSMSNSEELHSDANGCCGVGAEGLRDAQREVDAAVEQSSDYGRSAPTGIDTQSRNREGGTRHDVETEEGAEPAADVFSKTSKGKTKSTTKKTFGWRDLFSIPVRWRQVSEPCDTVVWVDLLSKEEFEAGFGSHTPILQGQSRIVRYYPNFGRAFALMKQTMIDDGEVYNGANKPLSVSDSIQRERIIAAQDCKDLYPVVGEDFWVVTPCQGIYTGKVLEGTRLTLQKSPSIRDGYNFSIRTPGTPPRWADYDAEFEAVWQDLCDDVCSRSGDEISREEKKRIQDRILTLSFYWYNFMPLARGTAVVGYITLIGLLMACGLEPTVKIPKGIQVDWEAILTRHPDQFISSVKTWLYPSIAVVNNAKCGTCDSLPLISEAFPTLAHVIGALNRSVLVQK